MDGTAYNHVKHQYSRQNEPKKMSIKKLDFAVIEAESLTIRLEGEQNPRGLVTWVASGQGVVAVSGFLPAVKGGFCHLKRGVSDLLMGKLSAPKKINATFSSWVTYGDLGQKSHKMETFEIRG